MFDFLPRTNFHRLLEPNNQILHGAGQSPDSFLHYWNIFSLNRPILYMGYIGAKKLSGSIQRKLAHLTTEYPNWNIIPQIGLSMTHDGQPEKHYEQDVADGLYDDQFLEFFSSLAQYPTPLLVRLGYEFNGQWNGYQPDTFVRAWQRIHRLRDEAGAHNKAPLAWCYAPEGTNKDFMSFYPGDEYVDWWSIDTFDPEHCTADDTEQFMLAARERSFPVMIGESSCRIIQTLDAQRAWNQWFTPYFSFIARHPHIKAFCYIDWNWSSFPQWSHWGEARVTISPELTEQYRSTINHPIFQHAIPIVEP